MDRAPPLGRFRPASDGGAPAEKFTPGPPGTCPCEGAYDDGVPVRDERARHYVWMAFLRYENEDYRKEQWLRDYRVLPTNWLTCKLSGSDLYHCQMFFWNQHQQAFVTFSVDAHNDCVHYSSRKQFGAGWKFLRLTVSQDQEREMYDFLAQEACDPPPFNWLGAMMLFVRPLPTTGHSWFCSQLDVAALHQAGILTHVRPEATSPSHLYDLLQRCGEVPVLETPHPIRTKQVWMRVAQQREQAEQTSGERLFHF